MKIKKRLSQNVLHPKSFGSNFWGAVQFETASIKFLDENYDVLFYILHYSTSYLCLHKIKSKVYIGYCKIPKNRYCRINLSPVHLQKQNQKHCSL